jgi:transposase
MRDAFDNRRQIEATLGQELRAADENLAAVGLRDDAFAGNGVKGQYLRRCDAALEGGVHYCLCERVLGRRFRRRSGSKHHLVFDGNGTPLNVILTGANRHDSTQLMPLLDGMPAIGGQRGRPLRRPGHVQADCAYDCEHYRRVLRGQRIIPQIGKHCSQHGRHLGARCRVVERTFAWLHQFRRLRVRYERRSDMHQGFPRLGCAIICWMENFTQGLARSISILLDAFSSANAGTAVLDPRREQAQPRLTFTAANQTV